MTEFVIDDRTAGTPIGELLRRAGAEEIRLLDAAGHAVGWIAPEPVYDAPAELTPEDRATVRKRLHADRTGDLTTSELLAHLQALTADA